MATQTYPVRVYLEKLTDELAAAFPEWFTQAADGTRTAHFTVEAAVEQVTIGWPDATPEPAVAAVVTAHQPDTPATRTLAERRAAKAAIVRERAVKEAT